MALVGGHCRIYRGTPEETETGECMQETIRGGIEGLWLLSESEDSVENGVSRMTPTRFWPVQPGGWGAGPLPGRKHGGGVGNIIAGKHFCSLNFQCGIVVYLPILLFYPESYIGGDV